jgi:hypothetical protein
MRQLDGRLDWLERPEPPSRFMLGRVGNVLRWLRSILIGAPKPPRLEEARYARSANGTPDLTCFTRSVEHYAGYIADYIESLESPRGTLATDREWQSYEYQKFVFGQWGLIARGPSEALPTVLRLLQHRIPEGRQAASGVLEAWSNAGTALEMPLLAAAEKELAGPDMDIETLSMLIAALGRERSETALPLLARVLRDPASRNGDLDWNAIEALGDIAGRTFVKEPEPKQAAERWLQARGI